jgi:hypothetical protein
MRAKLILLAIISLTLMQCKTEKDEAGPGEILIIGHYLNSPNSQVVLENLSPLGYYPLDTVMTDEEGTFRFRQKVKEIGIYRVRNNQSSYLTLIMSPGEKAMVSADALNVDATFVVSGPQEAELMYSSELRKRNAYQRLDTLRAVWQEGKDKPNHLALRDSLDQVSEAIFQEYKAHLESFIESNPSRLSAIFALYQRFAGRKIFDEQADLIWYEKVSKNLNQAFPGSPHAEDIRKRVEAMKLQNTTLQGDTIPPGTN